MKAMDSSGNFPLSGSVEVYETFVGGADENSRGRKKGKKKLSILQALISALWKRNLIQEEKF